MPVPGFFLDHGTALQGPVGRVHWAGTETAKAWNGYMDGAVESGQRAAKGVLSALVGARAPENDITGKPRVWATGT